MSIGNQITEDAADGRNLKSSAPIHLKFSCPRCQHTNRLRVAAGGDVACAACGWSRNCTADDFDGDHPNRCLVCGCHDLWPQKDFPQRLGLMTVATAIVLSTVAYALWQPAMALGILMFFALADCLLFVFMRSVLVCYRCRARHGGFDPTPEHKGFDLEIHERYRQEHLRLEAAAKRTS